MAADIAVFQQMKDFVEFTDADAANLKRLGPVFAARGGAITDFFYEVLSRFEPTNNLIQGRVDALKGTHTRWMGELFGGEYGEAYFANRLRIGEAHVRIGLPPYYVEAVMNIIRTHGHLAIVEEIGDPKEISALYGSLLKILDLDLLLINLAYAEERLDRVTAFTGMSRKLIENVINRAKK